MTVYGDGRVVVTAPFGFRTSVIDRFVFEKRQWLLRTINHFKRVESKTIKIPAQGGYVKNKNEALRLVQDRIAHFNEIYNFPFKKITIRNQKTRWGSCSAKKNLNFNYKILFLPEVYRDYIIVHELCHLKELNHSRTFWALVQKTFPNYRELRKELKAYEITVV